MQVLYKKTASKTLQAIDFGPTLQIFIVLSVRNERHWISGVSLAPHSSANLPVTKFRCGSHKIRPKAREKGPVAQILSPPNPRLFKQKQG